MQSFVVAWRDDLPHLPHPRDRRAAVHAHWRHRQGQTRRAGPDRGPAGRPGRQRHARGDLHQPRRRRNAPRARRSTGSSDVQDPEGVCVDALADARQLARAQRLAGHAAAPLDRHGESRPDHRRGAPDSIGSDTCRARHHDGLHARRRLDARDGHCQRHVRSAAHRSDHRHRRTDPDARGRQNEPGSAAAAADPPPHALCGAIVRRLRRSVDDVDGAAGVGYPDRPGGCGSACFRPRSRWRARSC